MITSVTTVTTMSLDVSKWCFYRLYGNEWCQLVSVVTEGGIELVLQAKLLIPEISRSTWKIPDQRCHERCASVCILKPYGNENQRSTSTRWSAATNIPAGSVRAVLDVQGLSNIPRGRTLKYARNAVDLAVEECARSAARWPTASVRFSKSTPLGGISQSSPIIDDHQFFRGPGPQKWRFAACRKGRTRG